MSRRALERVGLFVGVLALLGVLASATLIDRRPPQARISLSRLAADGRTALTHATIDVHFNEPVQRTTAQNRFRIQPTVDGTVSWDGDSTLIFTPARKLPVGAAFTVRMEPGVADLNGNASTDPSAPFEFTTVGLPAAVATTPVDGAAGVPLDSAISVTFDRLMDTELTAAAARFEPAVRFRAAWAGATLTLVPTAPLRPDTRYRLIVGDPAADTDGNELGRPVELRFATVRAGFAPARTVPADGVAGVPLRRSIAVFFDRPIDPAVPADAIRLTPAVSGRTQVVDLPEDREPTPTGIPSPARDGGTVLVFTADDALAAHTTYNVELLAGTVRALGSQELAGAATWSFTTGSEPEALQNQIVFLSARGGTRNVWAMNPDGTNARQVTAELAAVTSYDVSPDGRTVVYASAGRVTVVTLPGGASQLVTAEGDSEYGPRLLPDGSAVLLGRRERGNGADRGIWHVPLGDPGSARQLTVSGAPPLGSSTAESDSLAGNEVPPWAAVAAVAASDPVAIVVGPTSRELERLDYARGTRTSTGLAGPMGPVVARSQAGGFVAVATRQRDGARGSWYIPLQGLPTPGPELAGWPAVSASGAIVGLSASQPGRLEYRARPADPPMLLTSDPSLVDRQPTFAPDGRSVLFVRAAKEAPGVSRGIWVVGVDGRELRQLSADGTDPRWLP